MSQFDLKRAKIKKIFDLAPVAGNPRNSEGDFLPLNDGRILFVWSKFTGDSSADHASASIYSYILNSDGEQISEERCLVNQEDDSALNIMSLSLLRMQNGDIGLFYFLRRAKDDGRLWLRRSSDEGLSFKNAVPCTTGKGYYVTNNDRVLRLQSGRLIVPAAYHRVINVKYEGQVREAWDGRSSSYFFYSDDDGETWCEGNPCTLNARYSTSGLQEPGAIEFKPDCLYGWARTDMGCQFEMFSMDGGENWSEAVPSKFTAPCSPLSIKQDIKGRYFAIWNPIPEYVGRPAIPDFWNGGRTPLVIACTDGRGRFGEAFVLEDAEDAGFCYTAMLPTDKGFLLSYCAGQKSLGDANTLVRLRVSSISMEELDKIADAFNK